ATTAAAQSTTYPTSCTSAPVLMLDNPNPGDVLPMGDIVFSGVAYDAAATAGSGITRVDMFLGDRDSGGAFLGTAIPGSATSGANTWQASLTIPGNGSGGRNFVAYAISSVSGQETSMSVPVFIGAAPTPTPTGTN